MRCEHMVEKRTRRGRGRCWYRLKRMESKSILGGQRWHVFRCRRNHETRILVKP